MNDYKQVFEQISIVLRDYKTTFATYTINDIDDFDYTVIYGTDTNKTLTRGFKTEIRYISACGAFFVRIHNFDDNRDILNIRISVNHFATLRDLVTWLHLITFIHDEP